MNDFEGRYPEDNTVATNLAALAAWLVSTDQSAATNDDLDSSVTYDGVTYTKDSAAYRLAKFKAEFETHFEKSSAIFYYLFTELFLMVDSRAKNAFPSFLGGDKWCFLPYDFDTAIGINNEGALVFDYSLEDTDTTQSGADVFNGQQSVLWINLRQAFFDDIKSMYQTLRSTGKLSYSVVEGMFESHQNKWCEAIFNEDAWFKYIAPLVEDGSGAYLAMAQGSKAEQRKWWLYNRFRYMDSKYNAGDALTDVIQLRGYAKANVTVTPYADIYPSVKYGSYLVSTRGHRGTASTLTCPLDNVNDTEIYIYSASQLASVGDLSGLKVGFADFSMATRLQSIQVGSNASGYTNGNLTELYVGNNTLLNSVDARNCTSLASSIDLSGCTNVESVYFGGTAITSCALPNGGILKTLQLPATITNLTLRNQSALTSFSMAGYSNITTLRLENTPDIPVESILTGATSLNRVRIVGMEWTSSSEQNLQASITRLRACAGMDESGNNTSTAVVSGRVNVSSISSALLTEINTYFPDLVVVVDGVAQYLVRFMNIDNTLVYAMVVASGDDAVDPVAAGYCEAPTKASSDGKWYVFDEWQSIPTNVTSNMVVYATFQELYRVRYLNWDNTVLDTVYVSEGEDASYTGATPTKAATAQYTYTFSGWSGTQTAIDSSRDIVAQFTSTVNEYTITWVDGDGDTLKTDSVAYGSTPAYTGNTPTKTATAQYTYTFNNTWSPEIVAVTAAATYTAQFTSTVNEYTITWVDGDGNTLKTDTVAYGSTPSYSGNTPTKTATAQYTYTFNNTWSPTIVAVTAAATYTAQFTSTVNEYTITWVDGDGATLKTESVAYGSTPAYTGTTPTKTATAQYTYTFNNTWSPTIVSVTAAATYTAQFTSTINSYTITWVDGDGNTLTTDSVAYGSTPAYSGNTPTKTATAQYTYTFNNTWSPTIVAVTAAATYTAQFTSTLRTYTVRFINGSQTLQTVANVPYGSSATYTGSTPSGSNEDLVFNGWNPDGTNITGNTDCYAVFIDMAVPLLKYLKRTMTAYESDTATKVGSNAFYQYTTLETATTSAYIIEENAFYGCTNLTTVDLTDTTNAAQIAANAFSGCTKLTHLIIRSSTAGTMSATSALSGTKIASGNGAIYVPTNLVSTYKAASNWSTYANQIYPISAYPVTDFSTITDSWDDIFAAETAGTHATDYSVGDTKILTVSDGSNTVDMYMQIAGFDCDPLANGSGNAKISWICKSILTTHRMNATNTTTDGWSATEMRTWLRDTIYPTLPTNIKNAIKSVTKTYYDYGTTSTKTETDTIWIPSCREVGFSTNVETSGPIYSGLFTNATSRIKYNAAGSAYNWWLRSADFGSTFYTVDNYGYSNYNYASYSFGVVFGFCT